MKWYKIPQEMTTNGNPKIAQITGANIRIARDRLGLTQRQLGEAVGVEGKDVSRWETGVVEPGPKYRQPLAAVLFDGDLSALYRESKLEAA